MKKACCLVDSFLHWIYIIKELNFGYGKKLHCDRNFLIKRAKTTNDNLVECHFLTQQFLLIVATVCSTCLNTASAIRYTLHQLFFVCTRVERTSIARILTFHLSFVCWVILNWCSKNVKLDILIRSFWSFPIILRVKNPMSDNPDIFTSGD